MPPLKPRNRMLVVAVCECPRTRGPILQVKQTMTCGVVEAIDDTPRPTELENWVNVGDIVYLRGEALLVRVDGDRERLCIHESQVVLVVQGIKNPEIQDHISNKVVTGMPVPGVEVIQ